MSKNLIPSDWFLSKRSCTTFSLVSATHGYSPQTHVRGRPAAAIFIRDLLHSEGSLAWSALKNRPPPWYGKHPPSAETRKHQPSTRNSTRCGVVLRNGTLYVRHSIQPRFAIILTHNAGDTGAVRRRPNGYGCWQVCFPSVFLFTKLRKPVNGCKDEASLFYLLLLLAMLLLLLLLIQW